MHRKHPSLSTVLKGLEKAENLRIIPDRISCSTRYCSAPRIELDNSSPIMAKYFLKTNSKIDVVV